MAYMPKNGGQEDENSDQRDESEVRLNACGSIQIIRDSGITVEKVVPLKEKTLVAVLVAAYSPPPPPAFFFFTVAWCFLNHFKYFKVFQLPQ